MNDKAQRIFQAVTLGCGAFLATASSFTPPLSAWLLLFFGVLSGVSSAMSKRVLVATSKPLTIADIVGWCAALVVQILPGALGEFSITLPRAAALALAVAGTVVAMFTHGPAAGNAGGAS